MDRFLVARDAGNLWDVDDSVTKTADANMQMFSPFFPPAAPGKAVAGAVALSGRRNLPMNSAGGAETGGFFALTEENWGAAFALTFTVM